MLHYDFESNTEKDICNFLWFVLWLLYFRWLKCTLCSIFRFTCTEIDQSDQETFEHVGDDFFLLAMHG